MASGESNDHVTDDVTWPRKVKLVTSIRLESNIAKTAGYAIATIAHSFILLHFYFATIRGELKIAINR